MKNNLLNNNIADLIDNLIKTIFQSLNCVKVGKVIKFYPEDKTADIQIITKIKDTNNNLKDIAILSKCLVIGNKITLPIEEREDVVILFNDYDINAYFETGQSQEPYSSRKHSLSDGIVICGLNSIINAINYDNTAICFNHKQIKVNYWLFWDEEPSFSGLNSNILKESFANEISESVSLFISWTVPTNPSNGPFIICTCSFTS